jgi:hypothetical protein
VPWQRAGVVSPAGSSFESAVAAAGAGGDPAVGAVASVAVGTSSGSAASSVVESGASSVVDFVAASAVGLSLVVTVAVAVGVSVVISGSGVGTVAGTPDETAVVPVAGAVASAVSAVGLSFVGTSPGSAVSSAGDSGASSDVSPWLMGCWSVAHNLCAVMLPNNPEQPESCK